MVGQRLTVTSTGQALVDLVQYCNEHPSPDLETIQACLYQICQLHNQTEFGNVVQDGEGIVDQIIQLKAQETELKARELKQKARETDLKSENDRLKQENLALTQEMADLEIVLDNTTVHGDAIASDLNHQAATAKRQVEEQFRLVAEATPVGILINRLTDGQIIYANAAAGDILGLPPAMLVHRHLSDFDKRSGQSLDMMAQLSGDHELNDELQWVRSDGQTFWGWLSLRAFTFRGERATLMAIHDITARKKAEESLRLAEEQYRSIFENALEGIYQSTADGSYININPAMAKIHGYDSPDEMLSTVNVISQQVYVDAGYRLEFEHLIQSQGNVEGFEYQIYQRDGTIRWVAENARAVYDSAGQLLYYEGIIHDVTERKQRETNLQQQLADLRIEIDQTKRSQQVKTITQTDYFQDLQTRLKELQWDEDEDEA